MTIELKTIPHVPGVYKFLNRTGRVIYVGKAKDLANRVHQYFQKNLKDGKTKRLVQSIAAVKYIEVFSELEALILEAELIRNFRPKYNINLKDDKSYLYLVIRKTGDFARLITCRKNDLLPKDLRFGPYPDATSAKYVIRAIRKIFPYRDCSENKFSAYAKKNTPCLYGHLNLCPVPCNNRIDKKTYQKTIRRITGFLRGRKKSVVSDLRKEMQSYAKKQRYELAGEVKKILTKYEYIQQSFRSPGQFLENPYLVDDIYEQALTDLKNSIPLLKRNPVRIECYDVANILGKDAAVSMVVALNGRLDKRGYKKFKIRLKETPDDVFMLKEALTRRFLHEIRDNLTSWGRPHLVVVDGGKSQVGGACEVLTGLGLDIPVIGLAKKLETVIYHQPDRRGNKSVTFTDIRLERSSEGLKLLQRLRDESHRFARVYHHYLRSKNNLL